MQGTISGRADYAIDNNARYCREAGTISDVNVRFARAARDAFGFKAQMAITQYCGCPTRTAYNYTSAHSHPSEPVIGALLDGDEGEKFFFSYMRLGRQPQWFRRVERALEILTAIEGVTNVTTGMHDSGRR